MTTTPSAKPHHRAVTSPLVAHVLQTSARHPAATAVRTPRTTLSYADLSEHLHAWSTALGELDLPTGTVIALDILDPTYLAPAHLAVRSRGHIPMLLDPHLPPARRAALLEAGRPALVMDIQEHPRYTPHRADGRTLDPQAGYLGFTSGTQGPPKGIVSQERGVLHFVTWEAQTIALRPGQPVGLISPPSFEVVFRELFMTLTSGAELVVATPQTRIDPSAIVPWLADEGVEVIHAVPSLATRWLEANPGRTMDQLVWTLFAGEPLHATQVTSWRTAAPRTQVVNLYGPSETTLAKFWYHVPPKPAPGIQPVGRPLPGTDLRPLPLPSADATTTHAMPADDTFQISIATPHGSLGYLAGTGTPADHAALRRGAGITTFDSQDLGRLDAEGNLVVTGRLDSRVKRRGVFVDLGRIEALAARHPDVTLACCFQTSADTGAKIVLVVESDQSQVPATLSRELRRTLGPEAPEQITAVTSMPLSPNGKIDRRALADRERPQTATGPEQTRQPR